MKRSAADRAADRAFAYWLRRWVQAQPREVLQRIVSSPRSWARMKKNTKRAAL